MGTFLEHRGPRRPNRLNSEFFQLTKPTFASNPSQVHWLWLASQHTALGRTSRLLVRTGPAQFASSLTEMRETKWRN